MTEQLFLHYFYICTHENTIYHFYIITLYTGLMQLSIHKYVNFYNSAYYLAMSTPHLTLYIFPLFFSCFHVL